MPQRVRYDDAIEPLVRKRPVHRSRELCPVAWLHIARVEVVEDAVISYAATPAKIRIGETDNIAREGVLLHLAERRQNPREVILRQLS